MSCFILGGVDSNSVNILGVHSLYSYTFQENNVCSWLYNIISLDTLTRDLGYSIINDNLIFDDGMFTGTFPLTILNDTILKIKGSCDSLDPFYGLYLGHPFSNNLGDTTFFNNVDIDFTLNRVN